MENNRRLLPTGANMYSVGIWFKVPLKIARFCDWESHKIGRFKILGHWFLKLQVFLKSVKTYTRWNKPVKGSERRRSGSWWVKTLVQKLKHQKFFTYHKYIMNWGLRKGWMVSLGYAKRQDPSVLGTITGWYFLNKQHFYQKFSVFVQVIDYIV